MATAWLLPVEGHAAGGGVGTQALSSSGGLLADASLGRAVRRHLELGLQLRAGALLRPVRVRFAGRTAARWGPALGTLGAYAAWR